MRRSVLALALVLGCSPTATPMDGGRDAPRPPDVGFDPSALAPCELDPSAASDLAPFASYTRLVSDPANDRLFYPFVVLADDGSAADLAGITDARRTALDAASGCGGDAACVRVGLAWTEGDAAAAAGAAADAIETAGTTATVLAHLRGAGVCVLFDDGDDAVFLRTCLADTLLAATTALDAHVLGELDAAALDAVVDAVAAEADLPFWGATTEVVVRGLLAAEREEPIRYEPLDDENAAALTFLATVDFDTFPFAAIVVPGQGPDDSETILHPSGRARADSGYDRWAAGLAPVVLVSGGHVHPDRTPYSEAIEMRRYLLETRGMPASAVLVDPYARHTTTNLRNATRILARAGVPLDRPLLVTTDALQAAYIQSDTFDLRNDDELGYRPYAALTMLSALDGCFFAVRSSMHVDARDPLDP